MGRGILASFVGVDRVSRVHLKRADRCTAAAVARLGTAKALLQIECLCTTASEGQSSTHIKPVGWIVDPPV